MLMYGIIEVDEVIELKRGETLTAENLAYCEHAQNPINNGLSDDLNNLYQTIEDAREAFKAFKARGRVDMDNDTKNKYYANVITYQIMELEVENGNVLEWGGVWDITPFTVNIGQYGEIETKWE